MRCPFSQEQAELAAASEPRDCRTCRSCRDVEPGRSIRCAETNVAVPWKLATSNQCVDYDRAPGAPASPPVSADREGTARHILESIRKRHHDHDNDRCLWCDKPWPCVDYVDADAALAVEDPRDARINELLAAKALAEQLRDDTLRDGLDLVKQIRDLRALLGRCATALDGINGCIVWSDSMQQWHLLPRLRTQPALTLVRTALDAIRALRGEPTAKEGKAT